MWATVNHSSSVAGRVPRRLFNWLSEHIEQSLKLSESAACTSDGFAVQSSTAGIPHGKGGLVG
jgi:hypothetical protein